MRNQTSGCKSNENEAERQMNILCGNPNNIFKIVKLFKKDGKNVEGGRYIRGSDGRLAFNENNRKKIWKDYMENIINEENKRDHLTKTDTVKGPIEKVTLIKIVHAIKGKKIGKAAGPSEVSTEMIAASGRVGIGEMVKLCQRVLDRGERRMWWC